ncbi:unnamed protein product, partial [Pleuronectes platessa]
GPPFPPSIYVKWFSPTGSAAAGSAPDDLSQTSAPQRAKAEETASQVHQKLQQLSVRPPTPLPLNQPQCPHMRKESQVQDPLLVWSGRDVEEVEEEIEEGQMTVRVQKHRRQRVRAKKLKGMQRRMD